MSYTHNIVIELGLLTSIEFTAAKLGCQEENTISFSRVSEEGMFESTKGAVFVNLNKLTILFSYDIFDMKLDITEMKKVDDNYHFKCVNDLFRVDVYICEYDKWVELNKDIFIP